MTAPPTPPPELRDALRALVDREVQRAHRELLEELAETKVELIAAKRLLLQKSEHLEHAIADLNKLRGITAYDANGVAV